MNIRFSSTDGAAFDSPGCNPGYRNATLLRSPVRASFLAALALLTGLAFSGSTASAQVQLPIARAPGDLSDEVLAAQVKVYIDPLRERLPIELRFAKKVGQLNGDQLAVLQTVAEAEIERISQQTASVLRDYWKTNRRRRVVTIDGKAITVPANLDQWLVEAPGSMVHQFVADSIKAKWPETWEHFDAERERLNERRRSAAVLAYVALVDEALFLSSQQRSDLCRRLEAIQTDPLRRPAAVRPLIEPALERLHASLAAWQFDSFSWPEADLAAVLRPAQMAALQELKQPRQQEMVIVQQAAPQRAPAVVRAPAVLQLDANRPPQIAIGAQAGIQQEAAAALRANQAVRRRVVRRGPSTTDLQAELTHYVERLICDIDAACELTGPQRQKLMLAGKLDIEHWREESAPAGDQLAPGEQLVVQQVPVAAAGPPPQIAIFHTAESSFQRACQNRLDGAQRRKLAAARRERRDFQQQVLVELAVTGFERSAALTSQQCEQLSSAIAAALPDGDREADDWRLRAVHAIAQLPAETLEILDEAQQAAVSQHQAQIAAALQQFEAQTMKAAAPAVPPLGVPAPRM